MPLVWSGGIGLLFTYGQTGSGKIFTTSKLEQRITEALMDGNVDGM